MINDLQSIADDILARTAKIADDVAAIAAGKAVLSDATLNSDQRLVFTNALGMVKTSRASNGSSTPYLAVDESKLTPAKREQLLKAGILVVALKMTPARKPAVTIELATKPVVLEQAA